MPPFPSLEEPLRDELVALRQSAERDIPEILIAYQDDPHLHVRMGEERPPSGAELGRRSEQAPAERLAGTHLTLTILEQSSDVCRGQVYVHNVDWDHRRAELGIWLAPQMRNRGMARSSLRLTSAWLFETCALERVQVLTAPDNEPMIRAARAAGFSPEGILRGYARERDRRVDAAVMSLLPVDVETRCATGA
jgi:RimJ/RimL family protein N-acetyltransferase